MQNEPTFKPIEMLLEMIVASDDSMLDAEACVSTPCTRPFLIFFPMNLFNSLQVLFMGP